MDIEKQASYWSEDVFPSELRQLLRVWDLDIIACSSTVQLLGKRADVLDTHLATRAFHDSWNLKKFSLIISRYLTGNRNSSFGWIERASLWRCTSLDCVLKKKRSSSYPSSYDPAFCALTFDCDLKRKSRVTKTLHNGDPDEGKRLWVHGASQLQCLREHGTLEYWKASWSGINMHIGTKVISCEDDWCSSTSKRGLHSAHIKLSQESAIRIDCGPSFEPCSRHIGRNRLVEKQGEQRCNGSYQTKRPGCKQPR